ncbi:hypothetical protein L198_07339 [Cryptococcus wingfieldii CBS 7118]|uniref:SET domain-containing protein n=1 Tax=Cryptococcus wingfieldii CBS 7118 TaxID=1295528 RepID=A0A1E3ICI9_9TREE|nr:hypothetical protein L198_07339 [Cryptococcus wingfieldii CBS 7118]ODN86320.1 hypothetical protein L198_07339 [Cryptococcus wingfieldii CBS 7118]
MDEEVAALIVLADTGNRCAEIPSHRQKTFVDGVKVASARLGHHAQIDEQGQAQMVLHMKKAHELHVLETLWSGQLLQDLDPSLFLTRQQAECEATNPDDDIHYFYANASSKTTKVFSTVWHGAKCYQKPLAELQTIGLQDLAMSKTHKDRMIIGKVITPVKSGLCLKFHIEDPSGTLFPVLINYPTPIPHFSLSLCDTLAKLYPMGAILAIKSPRMGLDDKGMFAIKVDMAYEIEELHPRDPILEGVKWRDGLMEETSKGWKRYRDAGNREMKINNPLVALRLYSLALSDPEVKQDPITIFDLLLNRTEAYRAVHLYGHAFRDARRAQEVVENNISLSPDQNDRLHLRLAKAALGLRLYKTALKSIDATSKLSPFGLDINNTRYRVRARIVEKEQGGYDWLAIFRESLEGPLAELDVPNRMSSACRVAFFPRKGRGVIATRSIAPGEVIMVSKAIAPSNAKLDAPNVYVNCFDAESQSHVPHLTYMWVYRMLHKIYDDPSLLNVLGGFSSDSNPSPADLPVPEEDEDARLKLLFAPVAPSLSLDAFRQIVKTNCYAGRSVPARGAGVEEIMDERLSVAKDRDPVMFLHGMPSMMNHSCWPNMTECWYGDIMVVRASKSITSGEELTMSYVQNNPSFPSRLSSLSSWDFTCSCILCRTDSSAYDDPNRRAQIMESALPLLFSIPIPDVNVTDEVKDLHRRKAEELEKLALVVGETYAEARPSDLMGELAQIYNRIGKSYFIAGQHAEAADALGLFLVYAGITPTTEAQQKKLGRMIHESHNLEEEVILGIMLLAVLRDDQAGILPNTFWLQSDVSQDADGNCKWVRSALWLHNVRYGGGKALFMERYGPLLAALPVKFDFEK